MMTVFAVVAVDKWGEDHVVVDAFVEKTDAERRAAELNSLMGGEGLQCDTGWAWTHCWIEQIPVYGPGEWPSDMSRLKGPTHLSP